MNEDTHKTQWHATNPFFVDGYFLNLKTFPKLVVVITMRNFWYVAKRSQTGVLSDWLYHLIGKLVSKKRLARIFERWMYLFGFPGLGFGMNWDGSKWSLSTHPTGWMTVHHPFEILVIPDETDSHQAKSLGFYDRSMTVDTAISKHITWYNMYNMTLCVYSSKYIIYIYTHTTYTHVSVALCDWWSSHPWVLGSPIPKKGISQRFGSSCRCLKLATDVMFDLYQPKESWV